MKKIFLILALSLSCLCITMAQEASFAKPTATAEAMAWFKKGKWKNGFKVKPYDHINVQTFYEQYQKAPAMWDSIFAWLASVDPLKMEPSNNAMQWSHAYVKVLNQALRTPENCQWESSHHRPAMGCDRFGALPCDPFARMSRSAQRIQREEGCAELRLGQEKDSGSQRVPCDRLRPQAFLSVLPRRYTSGDRHRQAALHSSKDCHQD